MSLTNESFELGVVTVEVTTTKGKCHIEDWDPKDADTALEYAEATAQCSDVSGTVFTDNRFDRTKSFKNKALAAA